jgi:hypothetical protein
MGECLKMKIAILSDDQPSFRKPILKNAIKLILNAISRKHYSTKPLRAVAFRDLHQLAKKLSSFDAVIVCAHMPETLAKRSYKGIDILTRELPIPIINYDLCFWATRGTWCQRVISEPEFGGFAGFDRFDYYIAVSNISEFPVQKNVNWPLAVVGGDFRSAELYPEQTDFRVLIDFERNDYLGERHIQIRTLEKLQIPYTVLSGTYSHSELYKIFRKHSVYFLAHRESFGLPIVELQLCGCYIFLPYTSWAPSHYIEKSPYAAGEGSLNKNFILYNNDTNTLEEKLGTIRNNYDPTDVIAEFSATQPRFLHGDIATLKNVVVQIASGEIYRGLGNSYRGLENYIVADLPSTSG